MDTLETRGFTLIELLVVIAIIGLLSSIVLASLGTARGKAADAKRLGDMQSIRTALELYYTTNNAYPDTGGGWRTNVRPGEATRLVMWRQGLCLPISASGQRTPA